MLIVLGTMTKAVKNLDKLADRLADADKQIADANAAIQASMADDMGMDDAVRNRKKALLAKAKLIEFQNDASAIINSRLGDFMELMAGHDVDVGTGTPTATDDDAPTADDSTAEAA